jgi:hypothetical protein
MELSPHDIPELVDNLFARSDATVHLLFSKIMEAYLGGGETPEEDNRLAES